MKTAAGSRDQVQRLGKETLVETDEAQRAPCQQGWTRFAHAAGPDLGAVMRAAAAA